LLCRLFAARQRHRRKGHMEGTNDTSTGSETTGPASFAEAFAADASSASSPSPEASAVSASADTTVPPAADATADGQPQQPGGEPPKERWADILENARTKARDEAVAQWKEQYGWAEKVNPDILQKMAQVYSQMATDPVAFTQQMVRELTQHPQYSQQLRSMAAKTLAQRQQQAQPTGDLPVIQLEDGRSVDLNALKRQWQDEIDQKYAPALQTAEQLKQERAIQAAQAQADSFATSFYADLQKLPSFKEHEREIKARIAANPLQSDHPDAVRAAAFQAYHEVVLPKLGQQAQSKLLDNLQQKAAASTSPNPGSAAPTAPKAVTSFHQLGADAWR
jgi:hypothetical protein